MSGVATVAYAVVHDDPPQVLVATDVEVLHRVLALEVVARTGPGRVQEAGRDAIRAALLDERWDAAVLEWMARTGTAIDVYHHQRVHDADDVPADLLGAQLQFTRLFAG